MKCSVNGCIREAWAKSLCNAHYLRKRYFGGINPSKPIGAKNGRHGSWKGGMVRNAEGRVLVLCRRHPYPNHVGGYVFRYRLVMERELGRILLPSELVHHKNGIVDDDRPENLEVITRSAHINLHRPKLTAARAAQGWVAKPPKYWLSYKGQTLSISDWSRKTGLTHSTIFHRLKRDLPIEKILNPAQQHRKR